MRCSALVRFRVINVAATSFWMICLIVFPFRVTYMSLAEVLMLLVGPICIGTIVVLRAFEKDSLPAIS